MSSHNADDRRTRMEEAIEATDLADLEGIEVLYGWLDQQPLPEDDPAVGEASLVVALAADVSRVTWYAAGSPDAYAEATGAFLAQAGATEEALHTLADAGKALEPARVGSWVELTEEDLDGGWYLPVSLPFQRARNYAPPGPVSEALGVWARRCGAAAAAQLRRSVEEERPRTELTIPLPGGDAAQQRGLAKQAFAAVGAPWFSPQVEAALASVPAGQLALIVALTPAGLYRAGVLAPAGALTDLDALLAGGARGHEETLEAFDEALGGGGPQWIAISQYAQGLGVELLYEL